MSRCSNAKKPVAAGTTIVLDSPAAIRAGGENGVCFLSGDPGKSRMIIAVSYTDKDLQMPLKERLTEHQVADLTQWVRMGAPLPSSDAPPSGVSARKEFHITAEAATFSHL